MKSIITLNVDSLTEHPAASIVPEMSADEWESFLNDVRERDIKEPIIVCGSVVIDGRHRLRAAKALHVDNILAVQVKMDEVEQLDYLVRAAIFRRHLSLEQKAMLAARLKPKFDEIAKEKQKRQPKSKDSVKDNCPRQNDQSRDKAAKAVGGGISGKTVERAEKVIEKAIPVITKMVDEGKVSVSAAAVVADLPKAEQKKIAAEGTAAVKEAAAEIRAAKKISGGTSFDVAEIEEVGNMPIEQRMAGVIEQHDAIANYLTQITKIVNKLVANPSLAGHIFFVRNSIAQDVKSIRASIEGSRPGAPCKKCNANGEQCNSCSGVGWTTAFYEKSRSA